LTHRKHHENAFNKSLNKVVGKVISTQIEDDSRARKTMSTINIQLSEQTTSELAKLEKDYTEQKQILGEVFNKVSKCDIPSAVRTSKECVSSNCKFS
jgi:hypothetical protein